MLDHRLRKQIFLLDHALLVQVFFLYLPSLRPTWPSHIDHILITDELFGVFANSASVIKTLLIENYMEGGWNEYAVKISDHRPVALKLAF